jgi:CRISPR/Cas system-associated exonuclease Cas4 (RecB family)
MSRLPPPLHATAAAIYAAYEKAADDGLRKHSGCSVAGHECARFIWNDFRWIARAQWPGRMLRVFDTGKREEQRVEADLKAIGCQVSTTDENGRQWRVSALGGHLGGSMDGAVLGLPEAPRTWHVLEIKTANDKSWKTLAKDGVRIAQPKHWTQMQLYMLLGELTRAVYISVNKNDDSLHVERVELEKDLAQAALERVGRIIFAAEPPPRISDDRDWWQCKSCSYFESCHGTDAPLVNCRTCAHSTPERDGGWSCAAGRPEIGKQPKVGCGKHRFIPVLLSNFAEPVDASGGRVRYRNRLTGAEFVNGDLTRDESLDLSSVEIRAVRDKAMLGQERVDPTIRELREEFGGMYAG